MSGKITRREFIIESGIGVTYALVSRLFARQALDFWANEHKPLLIPPPNALARLIAEEQAGAYTLYYGEIPTKIPTITWEQYLNDYLSVDLTKPKEIKEALESHGYELDDIVLDSECPEDHYAESWCLHSSPNAKAYFYLQNLKLGRNYTSGKWDPIGGLSFQDCPSIGSTFRGVQVNDELSLGVLQERLNQLGENIRIVIQ